MGKSKVESERIGSLQADERYGTSGSEVGWLLLRNMIRVLTDCSRLRRHLHILSTEALYDRMGRRRRRIFGSTKLPREDISAGTKSVPGLGRLLKVKVLGNSGW